MWLQRIICRKNQLQATWLTKILLQIWFGNHSHTKMLCICRYSSVESFYIHIVHWMNLIVIARSICFHHIIVIILQHLLIVHVYSMSFIFYIILPFPTVCNQEMGNSLNSSARTDNQNMRYPCRQLYICTNIFSCIHDFINVIRNHVILSYRFMWNIHYENYNNDSILYWILIEIKSVKVNCFSCGLISIHLLSLITRFIKS